MRRLFLEAGGKSVMIAFVCSDTDHVYIPTIPPVYIGSWWRDDIEMFSVLRIGDILKALMRYNLNYNVLMIFTIILSSNGLEPYFSHGWRGFHRNMKHTLKWLSAKACACNVGLLCLKCITCVFNIRIYLDELPRVLYYYDYIQEPIREEHASTTGICDNCPPLNSSWPGGLAKMGHF